jgi:hypothetical protein
MGFSTCVVGLVSKNHRSFTMLQKRVNILHCSSWGQWETNLVELTLIIILFINKCCTRLVQTQTSCFFVPERYHAQGQRMLLADGNNKGWGRRETRQARVWEQQPCEHNLEFNYHNSRPDLL